MNTNKYSSLPYLHISNLNMSFWLVTAHTGLFILFFFAQLALFTVSEPIFNCRFEIFLRNVCTLMNSTCNIKKILNLLLYYKLQKLQYLGLSEKWTEDVCIYIITCTAYHLPMGMLTI